MKTSVAALILASTVALPHAVRAERPARPVPPQVPEAIQVPPGYRPFLAGHAVGTQGYVCVAVGSGYRWAPFGPQATLFNAEGQQIIGVHTPEFAFEHDVENVRRAIRQLKVDYPVIIDNDYSIWRAFRNNYWPALYFVDARGRIRDRHFGEGRYDQSERVLQRLLAEAGGVDLTRRGIVSIDAAGVEAQADWATLRSPENYLGYERTENFASPGGAARDRRRLYAAPGRLGQNRWALIGEWTIGRQVTAMGSPNGKLLNRFHARDLHLVMGPPQKGASVRFRVTIDGKSPGSAHGTDVDGEGLGTVVEQRLYQLVRQLAPIADRRFEIEFVDPGVEVFAFTFG